MGILRDVQATAAAAAAVPPAASWGLEREDDRVLSGGGGNGNGSGGGPVDGIRMYLGHASSLAFNAALVACAKVGRKENQPHTRARFLLLALIGFF